MPRWLERLIDWGVDALDWIANGGTPDREPDRDEPPRAPRSHRDRDADLARRLREQSERRKRDRDRLM
jgi:hypothetical protein